MITGGHRGGVPRPCDHPLRDLPDHRPRRARRAARPRGRGDREAAPDARGLAGHRPAGGRTRPLTARRRDVTARARAAGRALRPRPVLRLAVPVLRLRGRTPARRRAGRATRVGAFLEAVLTELGLRADALDAAFGDRAGGRPRSRPCTSAAARRRCCPPTRRAAPRARARALRGRRRRRGHDRGQPGPDERGDPAALVAPASPACRSARSRWTRRAAPPRAAPSAARRRRRGGRGPGGGHRRRSAGPAVRRAGPDAAGPGWRHSTRRSRSRRPPVAVRADAGRSGRGGPDRPGGRPPADDVRGAPLARGGASAAGRGPGRGAVPLRAVDGSRPPGSAATRSRTGLGPATRAGTTSRTGSAPYEAVGPGAHAFDGATRRWNAARLDGYLARAHPPPSRPCRRAARRRWTPRPPPPRTLILGLRLDTRHPVRAAPGRRSLGTFGWALAAELVEVDRPTTGSSSPPAAACSRTSCSRGSSRAAVRQRTDFRPTLGHTTHRLPEGWARRLRRCPYWRNRCPRSPGTYW